MERETMYILDASVVAKWFLEEEYSDIALDIRESFVDGKVGIAVPDLILYELANTLKYKGFNVNDVKKALRTLFWMRLRIITPTKSVIESAVDLAFKHDVSFYDSYYLALAKELAYTLITVDTKFYNKTKHSGMVEHIKYFK
jgi:predicted nucleic acid-binding protein